MKKAVALVQNALKSTSMEAYDGPDTEDTRAMTNLAKMRVTLMVWQIMPLLRVVIHWRTKVTAHIHKQKEIVKKEFKRSERLAAVKQEGFFQATPRGTPTLTLNLAFSFLPGEQ